MKSFDEWLKEYCEAFDAIVFLCCAIIVVGAIFHILGLWFDIFVWFEKLCCWGLLFISVFVSWGIIYKECEWVIPTKDNQSVKAREEYINFYVAILFCVCILMAAIIYFNVEQGDRIRAKQQQQFERECAQNAESLMQKEVMCKASAMDWRDRDVKIASNTIEAMAGTLAIGTAIMLDGVSVGFALPLTLLKDDGFANFGGVRAFQDLVLMLGLHYVPYYSSIFSKSWLSCIYENIFVTVCVVIMYLVFVHITCCATLGWCSILLDGIKRLFKKR